MSLNFKHALLAGTAIMTVGAFGTQAQAADHSLAGDSTWGTTAPVNAPTANDNVDLNGSNLTINDTNQTAIGAITDTGTPADGNVLLTSDTAAADITQTIGSINTGGNFTVQSLEADNATVAATVTGTTTLTGNLVVSNATETSDADTITLTLTGNANVTGTTTVEAGGLAGGGTTATLNVDGAANVFTGAVTVTGGAGNAANDATIAVSGASTNFAGGLVLNNLGGGGQAILSLDGAVAQTVDGAISGDGNITITNTHASGVTFTGANTGTGTLTVNNDGNSQAVTFTNNVSAAIALGDNNTADTITATFGGAGATAVSGGITGGAAETVNVNFAGGNTVTLSGAATSGVDTTNVTGNTTVTTNQNYGSTNINVASGSTFATTANMVTATSLVNNGTLALNGGSVTAAITGTGLLDVNNAGAIDGAVTQGTADIAAVTLTQTTASGWTVGTTNFSGAGTLALAGTTQAVTGNFTNTTAGEGTITIANGNGTETTIIGNVGESATDQLLALTTGGGSSQTISLTGNLHVATTSLDDSDALQFLGTTPLTVSGAIRGVGDNDGAVLVGNGTAATDVTFAGVIGGGANTIGGGAVGANSTARFNANAEFATTYTNAGTTYVGQGATVTADSVTDTGTYYLNVVDADGTLAAADFGSLADSGNDGTLTASRLNINLTGDVGTGTVQLLTGINTGAATLTDNSIQYSFVTADNGANTDVTVARTATATLATGSNTGVATVLDTLTASTNTELVALEDNLAKATTQEQFNEILESVAPTVDGGAVVSGFNASVQTIGVTDDRLASLRSGNETSMVAGEMGNGLTGWVQGFGQLADQDQRDGVDGYEADTYGVAVGLDTSNVLEQGTVGVALSWANTDVDSKNANRTNADVDSYQVSLYGDYDVAPNTYLEGTLGYAWNDIDQTRHNVGGLGLNAQADYDSQQWIAYAEVGHDIALDDVTTFTPHVLAHYQHISIDDYLETGAGGLNQNVDSDDLDVFELGIGAEVAWDLDAGNGSRLRPALDVGYRHDFADDNVSTTSNFTGGGASFNTNGLDPADGTFNIGASVGYALDNNWEFTADYDYQVKSDYDAHAGFVRAGYKF